MSKQIVLALLLNVVQLQQGGLMCNKLNAIEFLQNIRFVITAAKEGCDMFFLEAQFFKYHVEVRSNWLLNDGEILSRNANLSLAVLHATEVLWCMI